MVSLRHYGRCICSKYFLWNSVKKAINKIAKKTLDVHLMIVEPDKYIETFKNLGTDILTVHYEACTHLHRTLQNIKDNGMKSRSLLLILTLLLVY